MFTNKQFNLRNATERPETQTDHIPDRFNTILEEAVIPIPHVDHGQGDPKNITPSFIKGPKRIMPDYDTWNYAQIIHKESI